MGAEALCVLQTKQGEFSIQKEASMSTRSLLSAIIGLGLLAAAAVLGVATVQSTAALQVLSIDATPETDTNLVGDDHTVGATVTDGGGVPEGPVQVSFDIIDGPNTDAPVTCSPNEDCTTDETGQVNGTYTGDGGVGTDTIEVCVWGSIPQGVAGAIQLEPIECDEVTKTWEEPTPTPTPTPTATPTPTPTPTPTATPPVEEAPDVLPPTGSEPAAGSAFPWAVVALALGGLTLLAGGAALLKRAR